jgi:hypothetical protein
MANLKPAPLHLTEAVTAKLVGDRPAFGKGVTHLALKGKLVDRPKGGEA